MRILILFVTLFVPLAAAAQSAATFAAVLATELDRVPANTGVPFRISVERTITSCSARTATSPRAFGCEANPARVAAQPRGS